MSLPGVAHQHPRRILMLRGSLCRQEQSGQRDPGGDERRVSAADGPRGGLRHRVRAAVVT